jgi:hypothetical protein
MPEGEGFWGFLKKAWWFLWEDDSVLSWIVSTVVAIVVIKFIIYPVLGLALGTSYPIVAVVSNSMEHDGSFDNWWSSKADCGLGCNQELYYDQLNISKKKFREFPFKNGFNKGDVMVLVKPKNLKTGEILVFMSFKADPIIHRVVDVEEGKYTTKGDHNTRIFNTPIFNEVGITEDQMVGKAIFRVPYVGYVKIWFVELISLVRGVPNVLS